MDASEVVDDILVHFGVKGMKWGVRRKATVGPTEVIVSDKRKKIKTTGGKGHPAHPDAVRVRTTGQIAKKSGLKAISDKDLKDFNNRLNMEQNAKRLMYEDASLPRKFVKTILRQTGSKTTESVSTSVSRKIRKAII